MGFFTAVAAIILIGWLISALYGGKRRSSGSNRRPPAPTRERTQSPQTQDTYRAPQSPTTYRPSPAARKSTGIRFNESPAPGPAAPASSSSLDLSGLHDALTGAALDVARGLFQCTSCKVFYHTDSLELLRAENEGRCVACQATTLVSVTQGQRPRTGKDYTPAVVTLADYQRHVGSVVTFEGLVPHVRESRRGNDFAVMFEDKSWKDGFKLVFFRDAVRAVGGKPYIFSLQGKRVRVRGLIVRHKTYGYEIIVSEPGMILGVH